MNRYPVTEVSDTATTLIGGYSLLTILIPVMIFFILLFLFVAMTALLSMNSKLSKIADMLEVGFDLEPVSNKKIEMQPKETSQLRRTASTVVLGIVVGAILLVLSFVNTNPFWSQLLLITGWTSIAVSVVTFIYEALFKKNSGKESSSADPVKSDL